MKFIIDLLITGACIALAAWIVPGASVSGFLYAILAGFIIGLVNATIGLLLRFLTLPLNILTLGLVSFIVTVLMVMLTSHMLKPHFQVSGFFSAALFAIIVAILQSFFSPRVDQNKENIQ